MIHKKLYHFFCKPIIRFVLTIAIVTRMEKTGTVIKSKKDDLNVPYTISDIKIANSLVMTRSVKGLCPRNCISNLTNEKSLM